MSCNQKELKKTNIIIIVTGLSSIGFITFTILGFASLNEYGLNVFKTTGNPIYCYILMVVLIMLMYDFAKTFINDFEKALKKRKELKNG